MELDASERRVVVEAYERTLGREITSLVRRPSAVWQQLYNRLRWEEDPVPRLLEPELERRSAPGAAPWLRTKRRLRESQALRFTLSYPGSNIYRCALSSDGDFVVTASLDRTAALPQALRTLRRMTNGMQPVSLTDTGCIVLRGGARAPGAGAARAAAPSLRRGAGSRPCGSGRRGSAAR